MSSRVNEVNGENLQDPPIKNPGYANALRTFNSWERINMISNDLQLAYHKCCH